MTLLNRLDQPGLFVPPHCHQTLARKQPGSRKRQCIARVAKYDTEKGLREAAEKFVEGIQKGLDEDDIVAWQLGARDFDHLSEKQQEYVQKIKVKLMEKAEEQRLEKERNSVQFRQGVTAYSRGQYDISLVLFKQALKAEGERSKLGGEIQLWLALSYNALGMEQECIELYKIIEREHPVHKVRKQAYELRYIMEAPKLTLGVDERIVLPILEDESRYVKNRTRHSMPKPPGMSQGKRREKTLEEQFWDNYKPPIPTVVNNRYVLVAASLVAVGLACYSATLGK